MKDSFRKCVLLIPAGSPARSFTSERAVFAHVYQNHLIQWFFSELLKQQFIKHTIYHPENFRHFISLTTHMKLL